MVTVYGIPSCGTVKKARAHLDANGVEHGFVDFRATPPSREQVDRWVAAFGAKALRNTSGGSFRALGAEKDSWSDERWAEAFTADPMLVRRPVIERDGTPVVVGYRDPDAALATIRA
ncbi:MAG: arsenate reductase family protein [Myxococcales bacterium]|nr:arsenate reductase family protein [Myxococcales bacterium]